MHAAVSRCTCAEARAGCLPLLHSPSGPSQRVRHCLARLGGLKALGTCLPHPPMFGYRHTQPHLTFYMTWLLGIQTRVLRLARQGLLPTDPEQFFTLLTYAVLWSVSPEAHHGGQKIILWRSEDNSQESIPCFLCVGSGVGLRLQNFTAEPLPAALSPVQDYCLIVMYLSWIRFGIH